MKLVDNNKKISKNNNQMYVSQKLTRGGGLYLFYKELNYKSILINLKQTTKNN